MGIRQLMRLVGLLARLMETKMAEGVHKHKDEEIAELRQQIRDLNQRLTLHALANPALSGRGKPLGSMRMHDSFFYEFLLISTYPRFLSQLNRIY
jgi:hypothetical protein